MQQTPPATETLRKPLDSEVLGQCVSFPKSGRTWLRVMLDELAVNLRYVHAGGAHQNALPVDRLPQPGMFLGKLKTVFLHRDPRDVVVSGYFQATKRIGVYNGTISDFLRDPAHGLLKVVVYNRSWLRAAENRDDICVVTYEGMHADVGAELRRILHFFGQPADPEKLKNAIEAGRFETMKEAEARGQYEQYGKRLRPGQVDDPESFKVRRGKVGGYVDYFSAEDIAFCD